MQLISVFAFSLVLLNIPCYLSTQGNDEDVPLKAVETFRFPHYPTSQKMQVFVKTNLTNDIAALLKHQNAELKNNLAELRETLSKQIQQLQTQIDTLANAQKREVESCEEAMGNVCLNEGIYMLNIADIGLQAFNVSCKCYDNEIWTIIQRREDGSVDFNRDWLDYRNGFGNLQGEFWFGLEKLHRLTQHYPYELGIWVEARNGKKYFARHKIFRLASETEKYRLTIGDFSGNGTNAMLYHHGMKFSTRDQDNDLQKVSCAKYFSGAWWFNDCGLIDLNGPFKGIEPGYEGIFWNSIDNSSLNALMAIRRLY